VEITEGIHAIDYGFVRSYLIEDRDRLTLIDTGVPSAAARVIDEIGRIGRKPSELREIVLTHGHFDHAGSVADLVALTGASVLAHRLDAPVIRGDAEMCPPVLSTVERPYAEQAGWRTKSFPAACVDHELDDGERLDIKGGATVVYVPGHTPGSLAVYLPSKRALFCGDTIASLNGNPIVGFFNCDSEEIRRSLVRIAEMDFDIAYFGHGDPLSRDASAALRRLADHLTFS
jgi:glyoxylase-like metal-dependent hydrolase (beta-lactamase superfamily II)